MSLRSLRNPFVPLREILKIRFEQILLIEPEDMGYSFLGGIHQPIQIKVFGTDVSGFEHGLFYPVDQSAPMSLAHQYDGEAGNLAGLDKGDGFEKFVHGAEPAGEHDESL